MTQPWQAKIKLSRQSPENVEPVEVPLDPALAIANRFGKLAAAEKPV
jgi:hypothetical protein